MPLGWNLVRVSLLCPYPFSVLLMIRLPLDRIYAMFLDNMLVVLLV